MNAKARLRGIGSKKAEQFKGRSGSWLKECLTKRGKQVSNHGRVKRKAELEELAQKAFKMELPKIDKDDEELPKVIRAETGNRQRPSSCLPRLELIQSWSYFSGMAEFTIPDLYTYLVGSKEEYTTEKLKSFKGLQGYKRFAEGHVQECSMYKVKGMERCFTHFKVLPTERSKTHTNKATYDGFAILENSWAVKSGFCPCKGPFTQAIFVVAT